MKVVGINVLRVGLPWRLPQPQGVGHAPPLKYQVALVQSLGSKSFTVW